VTFIDQVAVFGARYSLGNHLLLMLADERGAPIKRRATEEQAADWEAAGRTVAPRWLVSRQRRPVISRS
jgi:hypothetical protein